MVSLQWRHNECDDVSNHRPHDCLFRHRWKKTSKLRVTGLCEGNSPVTGEFPAQMTRNAENVSIWWRHHDLRERLGYQKHVTYVLAWRLKALRYSLNLLTIGTLGTHFNDIYLKCRKAFLIMLSTQCRLFCRGLNLRNSSIKHCVCPDVMWVSYSCWAIFHKHLIILSAFISSPEVNAAPRGWCNDVPSTWVANDNLITVKPLI